MTVNRQGTYPAVTTQLNVHDSINFAEQLTGRGGGTVSAPCLVITADEKAEVTALYIETMANSIDLTKFNSD